jgi:hypothetical protein
MTRTAPEMEIPGTLVFRVLYGSHAHGTATASSDEDWRGVFQLPNDTFLGLDNPRPTAEDKAHDQVFWELGHFCRLLLKGNPNIVGMLFAPDGVIETVHPAFIPLMDKRKLFVHSGTVAAYMGWVRRELHDIGKLHKGNAKRLSHVPRLLWEIEAAVRTGEIVVRPSPQKIDKILSIKTGVMDYDEAVAFCGSLLLDVEQIVAQVPFLPEPPREWLQSYLLDTRERYGR